MDSRGSAGLVGFALFWQRPFALRLYAEGLERPSLLDFGRKPQRHPATPRPGLGPVLRIAVLGRDLPALHLDLARAASAPRIRGRGCQAAIAESC